jgi:beta-lactamase regulating signal transducer with metallopeptidase domain
VVETLLRVGLGNAVVACLLAFGAAAVAVFARGRPALRHGLWLLVLVKLVTPPLWTVPVAWVGEPDVAAAAGVDPAAARDADADALEVVPEPTILAEPEPAAAPVASSVPVPAAVATTAPVPVAWPWRVYVLAIWGAGSVATCAMAAWRVQQFRRILRQAAPAPQSLQEEVEALARRLSLARIPAIGMVPGAVSPLVWALLGRPCMILPQGLWDRLDERQRATLLAHELAHLKRRDHWVRGLELVVTGLYWWLPVVWIARQALREAEEECCDAWVVWAFPDAPRTYAEALLETLDYLSGAGPADRFAVAASGLSPVHHLKRRMTMIMQGTTPRALTWSGLLAVLGLSATILPLSPTWAQQRPSLEDEFLLTLKQNHELNDPRSPYLIKVQDVQDKTLIGATFKHRSAVPGEADPNKFDMVIQARRAEIDFDRAKHLASIRLDGVETTDPREDVSLLNNTILEIPLLVTTTVRAEAVEVDEEDDEKPARDAEAREKLDADRGSRREGDRPGGPASRRDVREYRFRFEPNAEGGMAGTRAALEKMRDEIRELANRKGEASGAEAREQMERVLKQLDGALDRLRSEAEQPRPRRGRGDAPELPAPPRRPNAPQPPAPPTPPKPANARRGGPDAEKSGPEAEERRAEISRLRSEVAEHQKALMAAQKRLAEAMRRQAGPGAAHPHPEPFALGFALPGPGPRSPEPPMRLIRPDQDRRIAELEERLEKLQNEVKALRKDEPARK